MYITSLLNVVNKSSEKVASFPNEASLQGFKVFILLDMGFIKGTSGDSECNISYQISNKYFDY